MIESIFYIVILIIAFAIMMMVAKKPDYFWPALIFLNMISNGPRILGYFFLDELFTGFIVAGALLRISIKYNYIPKIPALQYIIWIIGLIYMVLLSLVGMTVLEDVRIIRWVFFYIMLGILSSIIYYRSEEFPFPTFRNACLYILLGSIVAIGSFLIQGIIFELILNIGTYGRFDSQHYLWSGSAYAVFPIIIGLPVTFFLINDTSYKIRIFAWFSIFLIIITGFYFFSRTIWMTLILFTIVSIGILKIKRLLITGLIFSIVFILFTPEPAKNIPQFLQDLISISKFFTKPEESDVTRNLQVQAAIRVLEANPFNILTGNGIYTNRFLIAPQYKILSDLNVSEDYNFSLRGEGNTLLDTDIGPKVGTTGLPALAIDTGFIGVFLFLLNFIFVGFRVYQSKGKDVQIFLMILIVLSLWLFVANILDIVLLYLLLMPKGLVEKLAASRARL